MAYVSEIWGNSHGSAAVERQRFPLKGQRKEREAERYGKYTGI